MATFNTTKLLNGNPSLIPTIADRIVQEFQLEGFTAKSDSYAGGMYDISLAKGGVFKAVMGMKSALKVTMSPEGDQICFKAGVGIFGQQAIPSAITLLVFWPLIITQIWGLVKQSKLDDKALAIAEQVIAENRFTSFCQPQNTNAGSFCPNCGSKVIGNAKFCPYCGEHL